MTKNKKIEKRGKENFTNDLGFNFLQPRVLKNNLWAYQY